MLLTLTYAFLTYFLPLKERWKMNRCIRFLTSNIKTCSIIFRTDGLKKPSGLLGNVPDDPEEELVTRGSHVEMLASKPKLSIELADWACYLDSQYHTPHYMTDENYVCVLLEAKLPTDTNDYLAWSFSVPMNKRIQVSSLSTPLAWKSGDPFGILMECTAENYMALGTAFMNGYLVTDEVLEIKQLISVDVVGKPIGLLRTNSQCETVPVFMSPMTSMCSSLENVNELQMPGLNAPKLSIPMEHLEFDITESNESMASTSDAGDISDDLKPDIDHFESGGEEAIAEFTDVDHTLLKKIDGVDGRLKDVDTCGSYAPSAIYKVTPDSHDTGFLSESDISSQSPDGEMRKETTSNLSSSFQSESASGNRSCKPPNILIYSGKKDSVRIFEDIKSVIGECVNANSYTLYHLKHDQVSVTPWNDNTALLIICVENLYDDVEQMFLAYFKKGGKVVSFCSSLDKHFVEREKGQTQSVGVVSLSYKSWSKVHVISSRYVYTEDLDENVRVLAVDSVANKPVIVEVKDEASDGMMLLTQVYLEKNPSQMAISTEIFSLLKQSNETKFDILRDLFARLGINTLREEIPGVTPIFLYSSNKDMLSHFWSSIEPRLQNNKLTTRTGSLTFVNDPHDLPESISPSDTPVLRNENLNLLKMDLRKYEKNLGTSILGRVVFYADVMKSTQDILNGFMLNIPKEAGVIVVACRQTAGKGRGGNVWLSPEGCALFSLNVQFPLNSNLGHRLPFLQHIASLAVVQAVRTTPGYEDIDVRLKWPNDIYYGRTMKMGGVLVNSSVMMDQVHTIIGCGFNVANENPTICVNDIIGQYNQEHGVALAPFSMEQLIGRTVTQIESLIDEFQTNGPDKILKLYYQHWLHSDAQVILESENEGATVQSLDENGFLRVKTTGGRILSVQPDGNSFDMMRNLVCMKTR